MTARRFRWRAASPVGDPARDASELANRGFARALDGYRASQRWPCSAALLLTSFQKFADIDWAALVP
jgi:hypothetical protein